MKVTGSDCQDCGLPCMREACRFYRLTRYYCDRCYREETLYRWDGEELCIHCIEKLLDKVEGDELWY